MWLGGVGAQQSEVTLSSRRWVGQARKQQLEKCLWLMMGGGLGKVTAGDVQPATEGPAHPCASEEWFCQQGRVCEPSTTKGGINTVVPRSRCCASQG